MFPNILLILQQHPLHVLKLTRPTLSLPYLKQAVCWGMLMSFQQPPHSMKYLVLISLLALAAGRKIQVRELQYGFCEGAKEPFSIDEVVLEPYPVVVKTNATIHLAIGITLNEPIPVGSTATLKIIKDGIIDIPLPCVPYEDIHLGSWFVRILL